MIQFLNDTFTIISNYVSALFQMYIVPGVSMGSMILISLLFFVIVTAFWAR